VKRFSVLIVAAMMFMSVPALARSTIGTVTEQSSWDWGVVVLIELDKPPKFGAFTKTPNLVLDCRGERSTIPVWWNAGDEWRTKNVSLPPNIECELWLIRNGYNGGIATQVITVSTS